jgi:hypothetical protein
MDMKSFHQFRENYDVYKHFSFKKDANEEDDKYAFRSIIVYKTKYKHSSGEVRDQQVAEMFPPNTLRSTDNRYEFLRQLDAYVKDLERKGAVILAVHPKGHPEYQKYIGGKAKGYVWKSAK